MIDASTTPQGYFDYFVTAKKTLVENGLNVNGIIKSGGGSDDPNAQTCLKYLRSFYDYGLGFQYLNDALYNQTRRSLGDSIDTLKSSVDAVQNGGIVHFYGHGASDIGTGWIDKLSALIDYIGTIPNAEIVTVSDAILNNYVPSFTQ